MTEIKPPVGIPAALREILRSGLVSAAQVRIDETYGMARETVDGVSHDQHAVLSIVRNGYGAKPNEIARLELNDEGSIVGIELLEREAYELVRIVAVTFGIR